MHSLPGPSQEATTQSRNAPRRSRLACAAAAAVAAGIAAGVLLQGCGGGNRGESSQSPPAPSPAVRIPPDAETAGSSEKLPGADATVNGIFTEQCEQCHSIGAVGNKSFPLDHEGKRHDKNWIEVQIRHPEKHNPKTAMPLFPIDRMTDSELSDLSRYLVNLK